MDLRIKKALNACLLTYSELVTSDGTALLERLQEVFGQDVPYLVKVEHVDAAFDEHPRFEELREIVFDLLLMNFFAADAAKLEADYLESEEWEAIEDQTIDRGTEILNLLLYLRECADEGIEPQLSDYLKEFLLVDEDEFQDEYRIYEPVIANQLLVESDYSEISRVASSVSENQELAELFYPMMAFFREADPTADDLAEFTRASGNPAFDSAVYNLLVSYNR
ncbi:hypothetical protein SAMN05421747_11616 [Parapedobacter composti]|uniref:Uncharacterized protein n=1 Tax=Parapedobacter composti TaxID=623281 RepID=A0A1I1KJW2_9SPHI|nr:hypothetical protein [Parapedobacter composti]SFC60562.1 hypothetical protein SAMN05421747_11616 [Parapedobacter composti]